MTIFEPDKARELLDGDFDTQCCMEWVDTMQAEYDSFAGAYIRTTPGQAALVESAMKLAQQVADLKYQYALQIKIEGVWLWLSVDTLKMQLKPEPSDRVAFWGPKAFAEEVAKHLLVPYRMLRRLATLPEVVE